MPRTIRLDDTDTRVFERAAEPGEWAVSGAFMFADADVERLSGKQRQAFARGFLGTASFGWSTFVAVAEIDETAYEDVVKALARLAVDRFGAGDLAAAWPAAQQEAEFAASLCEHDVNTLLAVERVLEADGIVERFRAVTASREAQHVAGWEFVPDDSAGGE